VQCSVLGAGASVPRSPASAHLHPPAPTSRPASSPRRTVCALLFPPPSLAHPLLECNIDRSATATSFRRRAQPRLCSLFPSTTTLPIVCPSACLPACVAFQGIPHSQHRPSTPTPTSPSAYPTAADDDASTLVEKSSNCDALLSAVHFSEVCDFRSFFPSLECRPLGYGLPAVRSLCLWPPRGCSQPSATQLSSAANLRLTVLDTARSLVDLTPRVFATRGQSRACHVRRPVDPAFLVGAACLHLHAMLTRCRTSPFLHHGFHY
jgi:hypothetical protein